KKGDTIIAAKLDRMFRSAIDALTTVEHLKGLGVQVVLMDISSDPVTGTGVGGLFFKIMAAVADFERERIAERTTAGIAAKKARGGHVGGDAPYGFTKEGVGTSAILKPNLSERRIIERMAFLHHQHGSYRRVAAKLNEEGLHGREGPWFSMQV